MDPLTLIPIAGKILSFVAPTVGRWLDGEKGAEVATTVVETACRVAGVDDPSAVLEKVQADPALAAELQRELVAYEVKLLEEETERLKEANATMRTEYASEDPYVRRWRPTWGYVTAGAWAIQSLAILIVAIGAVIVTVRGNAVAATALLEGLGTLLGALTIQWSVALTVLGVAVQARSKDKRAAAGGADPGGLSGLIGKVLGR